MCDLGMFAHCSTADQSRLEKVEVEYLTMPGWNTSTVHIRSFSDLPPNAQAYVRKIEELVKVPSKLYVHSLIPSPHPLTAIHRPG